MIVKSSDFEKNVLKFSGKSIDRQILILYTSFTKKLKTKVWKETKRRRKEKWTKPPKPLQE